ncbi:precorrin-3B C(17)-methyltransferase [Magnetovibrio sp. PR-2]|uniref:precorrin-3B C(17)-methyltransferase n=1 Tax=Magnetovibrio sp. PR-2 TaxID=3120356 RepID=UPI002FCE17BF
MSTIDNEAPDPGKLIGVSIGPGALDLMTVRAQNAVKDAGVIAYMHAMGKEPLALKLVQSLVQQNVQHIAIPVPMGADRKTRRECYKAKILEFRAHLENGRNVAFICEGDALFYGSFQYVMEQLIEDYAVDIIPGVTSVQACAAVAEMPLTRDNDTLHVLPATLSEGALLARAKKRTAALAFMKIGRHLDKVKRVLAKTGRLKYAKWIERATQDGQKIAKLKDAPDEASYFSLVLSPAKGPKLPSDIPEGAVILCLNQAGLDTAEALKDALPLSELWVREDRGLAGDQTFPHTTEVLQSLFRQGRPIVAIMATGIVVRALGPLLNSKHAEPPVVSLSPDGGFAIPVLGGHHGANTLASAIATVTNGFSAITTASDVVLGVALDEPPRGWRVENVERVKDVTAKLLNGEPQGLTVESGDADWLEPADFDAGADVVVTHKHIDASDALVLHPPTLALGVGCERDCPTDHLRDLVETTLAEHALSPQSIACVASIDVKADEAAVLALADHLGVPARFFSAHDLNAYAEQLKNPSDVVQAEVGCPGVSEGAALAASNGALIVEKTKTKRATCAVALSEGDIDPMDKGKAQGRLYVVGIGPGTDVWRTPQVTQLISDATDVVGYGFYLDLIPDLIEGKTRHTSNLSEEEDRVRMALDLAAEGKDVALISSGDIGIYAMASLVFELLDREDKDDWNRLYIQVEPGISAFQAAAARIGAPVGHDFCLISLSDLLTPWDVIQRRLKAAAEGGFVVSFYNPVSKRRRTQLAEARDILLQHRAPDTPVVLARQLGRPDEEITVIELKDLTPDHADMLTLVMVGGEDTRVIERGENRWVYTPRGYGGKMDAKAEEQGQ